MRMKIQKTVPILLIALFLSLFYDFYGLAAAQNTDNLPSTTTDDLSSVVKMKTTGAILQNVKKAISDGWQKMTDLKRGEATAKIKAWLSQRKEAIKQGWQEEKQEFKGGFKGIFSDVWHKIKSLFSGLFHKRGD